MNLLLFFANIVFWLSLIPKTFLYFVGFVFQRQAQQNLLQKILRKDNISVHRFKEFLPQSYDKRLPSVPPNAIAFVPTSGSSNARKLIPYTPELLNAFQNAIAPWLFLLYLKYPFLFWKKQYWIISPPPDIKEESGGIPVMYIPDGAYFSSLQRKMLSTILTDLNGQNIGCVSVWSASVLRTIEIEQMPSCSILSAWADEGCKKKDALIIQKVLGIRHLQPKGVIATEGIVTIPVGSNKCLLAYTSHYFEFIDSQGNFCEHNKLQVGQVYEIVLTTQGGFYRYRIGDRLRVTTMFLGRPVWKFEERVQTVDLRGEKLSELFLNQVCKNVFPDFETDSAFCLFAPRQHAGGEVGYVFYSEKDITSSQVAQLEKELCRSHHYMQCRVRKQLEPLQYRYVTNALSTYLRVSQTRQGCRIGDIKTQLLSKDDWWNDL